MRSLAWVFAIWLVALGARADEAQARELFGAGVEAMVARHWPEAARLLEASLAQKDNLACRFNLVVVQRELKRPLEVAFHSVAFLSSVEGRSHADEAAAVRKFLRAAVSELVTLEVEGLPLGAHPKIDGAPPRVVDGSRIYESPGPHLLELWVGERPLESIQIELGAGAVQSWPRVRALEEPALAASSAAEVAPRGTKPDSPSAPPLARAADRPASDVQPRSSNRKLALGLGLTGAAVGLAALASYGSLAYRAHELGSWGTTEPGYTTAAYRYQRLQLSVMPLALAGGALMASAGQFAERTPRMARAISIAALVAGIVAAGAGAALLIRTPSTLIDGTEITGTGREAGSLLLGGALPLLSYAVRLQLLLRRAPERR